MTQPLLSIGMIVKNEERCLEKCLKALEPLRQAIPCELVIADTGSTDRTKEIASKYADILFDFIWVNDFSKARNAVMDKCSGKWYLTVDADEYLNSSIEEIVFFLTSDLSKKYIYASIVQRNYSTANLSGIHEDFNAIRMVRMDTRKRYEGPIHEAFPYIELERTYILTTTIFDHDGYAELSPEHLKQKAERNLKILEKELAKEPGNIRCISQCLEACSPIHEKRKYYAKYAIDKLKSAKKNDEYIDGFGPVCAKQAIKYMFLDRVNNVKETADWVLQRFNNSFEVQIDINFLCAVNLYESNAFNDCIGYAKAYLAAITSYQKRTITATYETFVSSVTFAHTSYINTILLILSNSLIKQNQISEATVYLKTFDLTTTDKKTSDNWFSILLTPELSNVASSIVSDVINKFLEAHKTRPDETANTYNTVILTISKVFSCNSNLNYNIFENVIGTIGLSVKATNAKSKTEIEKIIKNIVTWEEFMPLALKKAIELKASLPKEFYQLNPERLNLLTQNLLDNSQSTIFDFCDYCISFVKNKIFYEIAFFYNVLYLILLTDTFSKLSEEMKKQVVSTFFVIAETYLSYCFTNQLLENESDLALFSMQHLFSATFVKAVKLKEANPMDYIKTLRYILTFMPNAKNFIEYLLEDFQKQEKLKKQNQIKNASPELIALAEQLKSMLSALPENSPELLAIKQSPMYKQVAFLIEN